ncbi:hypothetical protein NL676_007275 [Syzygium grande]|nr:hypothetical protein NL676_007275 [Syzygium grande]
MGIVRGEVELEREGVLIASNIMGVGLRRGRIDREWMGLHLKDRRKIILTIFSSIIIIFVCQPPGNPQFAIDVDNEDELAEAETLQNFLHLPVEVLHEYVRLRRAALLAPRQRPLVNIADILPAALPHGTPSARPLVSRPKSTHTRGWANCSMQACIPRKARLLLTGRRRHGTTPLPTQAAFSFPSTLVSYRAVRPQFPGVAAETSRRGSHPHQGRQCSCRVEGHV